MCYMDSIQRYLHTAKLDLEKLSQCLVLTGTTTQAIKIRWEVWLAVLDHKEVTHS